MNQAFLSYTVWSSLRSLISTLARQLLSGVAAIIYPEKNKQKREESRGNRRKPKDTV